MFLPIRTDSPIRRTPYVNYALIAASVIVYIIIDVIGFQAGWGKRTKLPLMLQPAHLQLFQFFTYQFLHGDRWHLLGNMFFLWLFGNSVNSKMGHATYLLFYLASGVFAGIGFAIGESTNPCLGASGAIAGITTAYLVLFPRSEVTVLYFVFIYFGTMQIPSMIWILGKMIVWDNVAMQIGSGSQYTSVAYEAHIAGYLFGFGLALLMLAIRALPRDQYDLFAIAKRWYQRRAYQQSLASPEAQARAQYGTVARVVGVREQPQTEPPDETWQLRSEITAAIAASDFNTACQKYERFVALAPNEALSRASQLAVANQFYSLGRHAEAADAYEKLLKAYPAAPERTHVRLILGILYARYLSKFGPAREYLSLALESLTDSGQREQAQHWLDVAQQT